MQIKAADDKQPQMDELTALVARPDGDAATRRQIETEICDGFTHVSARTAAARAETRGRRRRPHRRSASRPGRPSGLIQEKAPEALEPGGNPVFGLDQIRETSSGPDECKCWMHHGIAKFDKHFDARNPG